MRLVFCLYKYFPHGGLQRDFLRVAERCRDLGHEVQAYTLEWKGPLPPGIAAEVIWARRLTNHARYAAYHRALRERLATHPPDLVIGFNKMPGLDVYYAADPCYRARVERASRRWSRWGPRYRHFAAFEEAVFSPRSQTEILLLEPSHMEDFVRIYATPRRRFHLLPPGISRDRMAGNDAPALRRELRQELGLAAQDALLLLVGSGFRTKGLDRALRALAALPGELGARTRLIAIGHDNPRPFRRLAARLGIAERVQILGGRDDIPRFLFGADLLVHPAYSETAGMILLEATVAGLPVLTTDVCGYASHVHRAGSGRVLASPFRQQALDLVLAEMLASPERERWSRNGIAYGRGEDLYRMPEAAAALLEWLARERVHATSPRS